MEKNGALLQNIQNDTAYSKFNFVSIKEEPPEEMSSESELIHFGNGERQFQINSEDQQVHSATPLVCIYEMLKTVLYVCVVVSPPPPSFICVLMSQGWK
jgi:transcriptional antiterminator